MDKSLSTIRLFFFLLVVFGSLLVSYVVPEWDGYRLAALIVGICLGVLVLLIDILLKGISLRGFSAITFGLFVGWLIALILANSPFFEMPFAQMDPADVQLAQNLYLIRLALFVVLMYLGAVVAYRSKDEFHLVIPYVRFVPHGVDVPVAIVDTSALIDGRIVAVCEANFLGHALIVPRFVLNELQSVADASDPRKRARGRDGLETLNRLKAIPELDLRIQEASLTKGQNVDEKLVHLAKSMKAKLLTTDFNLAQIAEFQRVPWLNLNALSRALKTEVNVGQHVEIDLVKPGKEATQAVGYLDDGSMVVVNGGRDSIGQRRSIYVESIIPSAAGKMIFGSLSGEGNAGEADAAAAERD